jgi:hypothetical protein
MSIDKFINASLGSMSKKELLVIAKGLYNNQQEMIFSLSENEINNEHTISHEKVCEVERVLSNILILKEKDFEEIQEKREKEKQLIFKMNTKEFSLINSLEELKLIMDKINKSNGNNYLLLLKELKYHQDYLEKNDFLDDYASSIESVIDIAESDKEESEKCDLSKSIDSLDLSILKYHKISYLNIKEDLIDIYTRAYNGEYIDIEEFLFDKGYRYVG